MTIANMEYQLIRSRRRTLSIEISREAQIIVRAPMRLPRRDIEKFLLEKQGWIHIHLERQRQKIVAHPEPDEATWQRWKMEARAYFPPRVAFYACQMSVAPTAIHYSRAKTRFGSCSAKNSITFSLRLMDYPPDARDYVIVHELAHIKHKNHGKDFYRFVASVLPDFRQREALLKQ